MLFENLRVINDPTPRSAAVNMAIDEVLLTRVEVPVLRIYRWENRAVSFGYFIRHSAAEPIAGGREIVRRMTGGGIVEHGDDLTYSLIIPAGHSIAESPPRESYRAIHIAIAEWLESRGVAPQLSLLPAVGPASVCFESAAEFDLVVGPRKIAGAAQRRTRAGLLHQGSIDFSASEEERAAFPSAFSVEWKETHFDSGLLQSAHEVAALKYAQKAWTERV